MRIFHSLLLLVHICDAAFVAIDYGSEWMKASLMSPGRKIDVLLNTDSKRKIQSVVAWKQDDRLFGTDAFNIAARFPSDSFPSLKYLQGCLYGGAQSTYYSQVTRADVVAAKDRPTCAVRRSDGSEWTVEELVGMQFAYIKNLAEMESGEPVNEAIVTVPPFYTHFERQAVLDALDIAGLKPVGLINDGMAVAVNYAMSRSFPEEELHVVYDAGASSITATVVSFSSQANPTTKKTKKPSKSDNTTIVEVKGFGFDTVASGTELDKRLRDALVSTFQKKHGKSLEGNDRAIFRMWKEAQRVKAVLSANTESQVRVESLVSDIDFKDRFTRVEFEKIAGDLMPRYSQPIVDALQAANVTMSEIKSVILTGGASRIPMIKGAVQDVVGSKVANNVNADEAAVLGAAFYGTTLRPGWRTTKPMRFQDLGSYDVQLKFYKEDSSKLLQSTILSPRSKAGLNNAKTFTFPRRTKDFSVTVAYKNPETIDFPKDIFEVQFHNVTEVFAALEHDGVEGLQLKASFGYTDSGLIFAKDAMVVGETKTLNSSEATTSPKEGEAASNATNEEKAITSEKRSLPLVVHTRSLSIESLTPEQKLASRARLAEIVDGEQHKARREEAYNHLEGYLYRLRDLLDGDETTPFMEFVQPQEKQALTKGLEEAMAWLHEEGETADATALWNKRQHLETIEQPIIARYKEASTGPKALSDLQKAHALTRAFLIEGKANATLDTQEGRTPRFTDEELSEVEDVLSKSEDWLRGMSEKQKPLNKRQDPVLKTADMESRGIALQKLVQGLLKRKPLRIVKPTPSPSSTNAPTSTSTTGPGERPSTSARDEL
ncbi:lumenal Hsp70 protein [Tulasnella sp. 403]|nr:lumenal Hsp70 protein [Tulasnella sp. 403]